METSIADDVGSFFNGLFDSAAGAFKTYVDYDNQKDYLNYMRQQDAAEQNYLLGNNPYNGLQYQATSGGLLGGVNQSSVLMIAALGIGAALLLKALK